MPGTAITDWPGLLTVRRILVSVAFFPKKLS
jgi:hypothetical protein